MYEQVAFCFHEVAVGSRVPHFNMGQGALIVHTELWTYDPSCHVYITV
jgi:hypothetical protein